MDKSLFDRALIELEVLIETIRSEVNENNIINVLPFNYSERIHFIKTHPYKYYSFIQIKELHEEAIKSYAAYQAKKRVND